MKPLRRPTTQVAPGGSPRVEGLLDAATTRIAFAAGSKRVDRRRVRRKLARARLRA
jgi:hypothetical protein